MPQHSSELIKCRNFLFMANLQIKFQFDGVRTLSKSLAFSIIVVLPDEPDVDETEVVAADV